MKWCHPSAVAEIPVAFMCPCKLAPVVLDLAIVIVLVSKVCTFYGSFTGSAVPLLINVFTTLV